MSTTRKNQLKKVMQLAWQFVKKNGYTLSVALKIAWANIKLHTAMQTRIVKFYFQKVDGTIREAFGTLKSSILPPIKESGRTRTQPAKSTTTQKKKHTEVLRKQIS